MLFRLSIPIVALGLVAACGDTSPELASPESRRDDREPSSEKTSAEPGDRAISILERSAIPGEIVFVSERDGRRSVRAVRPNGTQRPMSVDIEGDLFPAAADPLLAIATWGEHHDHGEQLVVLEGSGPRRIGPATSKVRNPSWSPDGDWLVFEADHRSFRDLYRLDLDGERVRRLTRSEHGNFEPAVSPSGERIAFVSSRDGDAEIYTMQADGSDQQRLTAFHRDDWAPRWSPDGASIAFLSDREGAARIFVMRQDGTGQERLTDRSPDADEAQEAEPAWSPDGRAIAHVVRRDGTAELWVTQIASGESRRVSRADARASNPAWSPDGRYLVFADRRDGNTDLYLVRADGTGLTRLTSHEAADWLPRWAPKRQRS